MKSKLTKKFASLAHTGPSDVARFIDMTDGETAEIIRRDACEYSVEYEPPNPTRRAMRFVVESHLTI